MMSDATTGIDAKYATTGPAAGAAKGDVPRAAAPAASRMDVDAVRSLADAITAELRKAVRGQQYTLMQIVIALLARGHVLVEGLPGLGKSLAAQALRLSIKSDYKRIQFTPDLMPSDIVGTSVYDDASRAFRVKKGPVFTNILLADEINRAPAKTQSALLEAMQERCVTIDGSSWRLPDPFLVIATENPIEMEGTYPLPEAQIDRFLMKILVDYPSKDEEVSVLAAYASGFEADRPESAGIVPVATPERIVAAQAEVSKVIVEEKLQRYSVDLARATRVHPDVEVGASPRGSIALFKCAQARAALEGRDFAIPDDMRILAHAVFRHRVILKPEAEIEGRNSDHVIDQILKSVEVPR